MTKIVVIGGGPGGYVAAIRAAQLGAEVTLIEKEHLGGTCLNIGCIPTKALMHSAELFEEAKNGAACGVLAEPKLDFTKVQEFKASISQKLVGGVRQLLKGNKVNVISGTATFVAPNKLSVESSEGKKLIDADKVIIATGSVPFAPPIPGLDGPKCIDSTAALNLRELPKSMIIIGGGVIGMEMATVYSIFGTKVTVVEMMPELLPMVDQDVVAVAGKKLEQCGVELLTSAKVTSVVDGKDEATVKVEKGGKTLELKAEKVLVAIGRRANTAGLGIEKIGLKAEKGRITVNEYMETSVKGVYAIGDCASKVMLAHVASAQGEIAAENAMGAKNEYVYGVEPSCVYTLPEIASCGLTEMVCKEQNIPYVVGRFPLTANGKSLIMNGGVGLIKIIAGKECGNILGVHIVGPRATDLIVEAVLAMKLEATLDEIIETVHSHPTVSEAFREAALAAEKRAIHIINK